MFKRILLVLAISALAGVAAAQDFFHRPSPFAGRTMLTLALFEEVRTELKTTPDENKKVDDLVGKLGGDIQEAFSNANGDFQAMQGEIEKINAKYDDEVVKALTEDQAKRLKQLFVQYNGAGSITQTSISKDLAITDDQKAKIKKLQDDQRQKMMDAFQGGSPEDAQKTIKKLNDDLRADLAKVLTDDQNKKLKEMEGAKFEFKKVEG